MSLYGYCLKIYYIVLIFILFIKLALKQRFRKHIKFDTSGYDCLSKVAIVTGGSTGIGFAVAKRLAGIGVHVIMGSRREQKRENAVSAILKEHPNAKVEYHQLDLTCVDSIHSFVEKFLSMNLPLHYLVNNAGAFFVNYEEAKNGVEKTLMTNFIGGFLLTRLLLPSLKANASAEDHSRLVNVSSEGHQILGDGKKPSHINWDDLNGRKYYNAIHAYAQSKAFQIMHAYKLQRLFHVEHTPMNAIAIHPGCVETEIAGEQKPCPSYLRKFILTPDQASDVILYALLDKKLNDRGILYLDNCYECQSLRSLTYMPQLQDRLWKKSCEILEIDEDPKMWEWMEQVEYVEKLYGVNKEA